MSTKEMNDPTARYTPGDVPQTNYDDASQEWDRRIGAAVVQAYNWRRAFFGSLILCLLMAGGMIWMNSKTLVTTYVVEVSSENGRVLNVVPAVAANYTPQEEQVRYHIGELIRKTRSIPLDPVVFRTNWEDSYAYMSQAAKSKMSSEYERMNPNARLGKEMVQIKLKSVLPSPMAKNNYEARWEEEVYSSDGRLQQRYAMTGYFMIDFSKATTEKEALSNPLGLIVKDFSWSQDLSSPSNKTAQSTGPMPENTQGKVVPTLTKKQ